MSEPTERRPPSGLAGRRDDDALDPAVLAGYEQWAGQMWRNRGKIAAVLAVCSSLAGCVVGYLGRAHDLDLVRTEVTVTVTRLEKVEAAVTEQAQAEAVNRQMLCSLVRRVDPPGVPPECGMAPRR